MLYDYTTISAIEFKKQLFCKFCAFGLFLFPNNSRDNTFVMMQVFDAGETFMIQLIDSDSYEDDIEAGDEAQDIDEDAATCADVNGCTEEQTSWRVVVSSPQGIDHLDSQQLVLCSRF